MGNYFIGILCALRSGAGVGVSAVHYYHLAFATKLPFYLGLGMPVLCSNARETASHVARLGVGLCWPVDDFATAFATLAEDRSRLRAWRERVLESRAQFQWSEIYARALRETITGPSTREERRAA